MADDLRPEGQQQRTQLHVDDSNAHTFYSSTSRISGSAEEIIIDFSQGMRPGNRPNTAVLKIDGRAILSPWAAKRLALALNQTVQRYEQAYGALEIDPRRRQQQNPQAGSGADAQATTQAT